MLTAEFKLDRNAPQVSIIQPQMPQNQIDGAKDHSVTEPFGVLVNL